MLNPVILSRAIKDTFADYVATTLSIADERYASLLKNELRREGIISKGPYLELGDAYKTGATIRELIAEDAMSHLFERYGQGFKLSRSLYVHQEKAVRDAANGDNMIVTTGTGSGKTECFLLPIVNALLKEQEAEGHLDDGVRAIIIYPMNALINDQVKRLREIFVDSDITFGVYNGNTEQNEKDGKQKYHRTYGFDPMPNERVSRDAMREKPPHILITNYSMLEYMCIRPNDDAVFRNAKLRFVVLDEAHIYKGATGIEASMLVRRVETRLTNEGKSPQYKPRKYHRGDIIYLGDTERHELGLSTFHFGEHQVVLQSTSNDSLMISCDTEFNVCNYCGYAKSRKESKNYNFVVEEKHKTSYGRECSNTKLYPHKLSHIFKTDVVQLMFSDNADLGTMLSVMYALLRATSQVLDIESTDISGCLYAASGNVQYSIILYDSVPGGAGHIHRIAAEESVFQSVIQKAYEICSKCECSPSCYKCLRDYYNQDWHRVLNRVEAAGFLKMYL